MKRTIQSLVLILLSLATSLTAKADDSFSLEKDSTYARLYKTFLETYNAVDREKEFYKAADEICQYYRDHDKLLEYYKMQLNICLYDTENNKSNAAIKRANNMLEEMKEDDFDGYSLVYMALGTVFENRGNYRMARQYYEQALSNLAPDDNGTKMAINSRMAFLLVFRQPVEAQYWNKKYEEESKTFLDYRQVYLYIDALIYFSLNDQYHFETAYAEYLRFHDEHHERLDNYGMEALKIADLAFKGKYDEALSMLSYTRYSDLNLISSYDMRLRVLTMKQDYEQACHVWKRRAICVDSLNSDMLFTNLNELNVQTGLARTQSIASRNQSIMYHIVFILALLIIGLLVYGLRRLSKSRKNMAERNAQLASALQLAEEGQKMKIEFVRSVSHEIRTPLNAINGFNDILNTPGLDLPEEERADLLSRIRENVQAITDIVDEMLRVADRESNEYADKSDKFYCNQFLSSIIYGYRESVSGAIDLQYTSKLINRVQMTTNKVGLCKILDHLIQNAIKFTKEGFIRLHCEQSADGKNMLISVADSGKGIAKEEQDKIFEGFYKVDSFEQGIGLGLTVSKQIAKKLGGDLELDKNYIGGARFVLKLPIE